MSFYLNICQTVAERKYVYIYTPGVERKGEGVGRTRREWGGRRRGREKKPQSFLRKQLLRLNAYAPRPDQPSP